jgi:hypothetical protein
MVLCPPLGQEELGTADVSNRIKESSLWDATQSALEEPLYQGVELGLLPNKSY